MVCCLWHKIISNSISGSICTFGWVLCYHFEVESRSHQLQVHLSYFESLFCFHPILLSYSSTTTMALLNTVVNFEIFRFVLI
uniref:Uncharacterized protein n=1 Tax=Arundo donax TaxID=35708 RepID=A0A0A9FHX5_ARUDO